MKKCWQIFFQDDYLTSSQYLFGIKRKTSWSQIPGYCHAIILIIFLYKDIFWPSPGPKMWEISWNAQIHSQKISLFQGGGEGCFLPPRLKMWKIHEIHRSSFKINVPIPRGWVGVSNTTSWLGSGGGVITHVALFMCKVFHINLFQLEHYMSVFTRCTHREVTAYKSARRQPQYKDLKP